MADPTTVNTSLAIPIRGTDVGTWDLPVNGNFTAIDSMFGGVTTIALSSQNVTLLSSQGQNSVIRLTGTLIANVSIILPSIYKGWTIDNRMANSPSSFAINLVSTSLANYLGIPPGTTDVYYDGTTIDYRNLGKIGEYWDYANESVPTWVSLSTKPPYLNCNGTSFSSATYPILANLIGTTLPDSRGRVRITLNSGTGRTTVVNADAIFSAGGDQLLQAHAHTGSGTTSTESADHTHTGSGTTVGQSLNHTHTGSGTTGLMDSNASHTHTSNAQANLGNVGAATGGGFTSSTTATATINATNIDHTHFYSFTTSGFSNDHTHFYSFTTGTDSVAHTHTYFFTTTTIGGGASQNIQPSYVGGITMIRAA